MNYRNRSAARIPIVQHEQQSPFPLHTDSGEEVLDERCRCHHLRSEHRDTVAYGHGSCGRSGCACWKYGFGALILAAPAGGK